jgi:phosphoglycolate phosphatase-like HAD superfamily hydrolase
VPPFITSAIPHRAYFRPGFCWDKADAYLFDIDGTLLNCRDGVHFQAFHCAFQDVMGVAASLDGLALHGNTDIGILRAALEREGIAGAVIDANMRQIVERMCAEVLRNCEQLQPELCPSIQELILELAGRGKVLGIASGNLEAIAWAKLERAGLRRPFSFGSFAWPRESRVEIFGQAVASARERLGQSTRICVIGDTPADVHAAKACGVSVIALATGIFEFAELRAADPDACCSNAADLLK